MVRKLVPLDFSQDLSDDELHAGRPVELVDLVLEAHGYLERLHAGVVRLDWGGLRAAVDKIYQLLCHGFV